MLSCFFSHIKELSLSDDIKSPDTLMFSVTLASCYLIQKQVQMFFAIIWRTCGAENLENEHNEGFSSIESEWTKKIFSISYERPKKFAKLLWEEKWRQKNNWTKFQTLICASGYLCRLLLFFLRCLRALGSSLLNFHDEHFHTQLELWWMMFFLIRSHFSHWLIILDWFFSSFSLRFLHKAMFN